jgi:hypothetical protein
VVTSSGKTLSATLTGLKAATAYAVTVKACADAPCRQSGAAAAVSGTTATEYWQLKGTGNTTAGLSKLVRDGNVRISATRFGPEAGGVTANRIQLYYGPMPPPRGVLTTAITATATSATEAASYLSFTGSGGTPGLITPPSPATLVESVATGATSCRRSSASTTVIAAAATIEACDSAVCATHGGRRRLRSAEQPVALRYALGSRRHRWQL